MLNLFVDHDQSLSIEDISKGRLVSEVAPFLFTIPIEDTNYWFSFTFENDGDQEIKRVVLFDEPFLYNENIYYQQSNGQRFQEKMVYLSRYEIEQYPIAYTFLL
jgi:hypothetical protein